MDVEAGCTKEKNFGVRSKLLRSKKSKLQVQTPLPEKKSGMYQSVLRHPCRASFTIEAAFALSIFVFACVVLMTPLLIFDQHRHSSAVMEEYSRNLSKYKYAEYVLLEGREEELDPEVIGRLETGISGLAMLPELRRPGMKELDILTQSETDGDMIRYVLNYKAILPFGFPGLDVVPQQVVSSRRAWIGAEGARWEARDDEEEDADDPTVYVGITSVRYHPDAGCSYLRHNVYTATGEQLRDMRTQSGGRYSPCASCKPSLDMGQLYYTDNGRAYHGVTDCNSMRTYVQARKLSEVAYMGACSRCG